MIKNIKTTRERVFSQNFSNGSTDNLYLMRQASALYQEYTVPNILEIKQSTIFNSDEKKRPQSPISDSQDNKFF